LCQSGKDRKEGRKKKRVPKLKISNNNEFDQEKKGVSNWFYEAEECLWNKRRKKKKNSKNNKQRMATTWHHHTGSYGVKVGSPNPHGSSGIHSVHPYYLLHLQSHPRQILPYALDPSLKLLHFLLLLPMPA
jgi:hypothetical protein